MHLKSLQVFFQNGLLGYYPKEEISAFFYRICEHHLKLKRIEVHLKADAIITTQNFEYFEDVISRLLTYEPIQYILGTTSFFGLDFKVDPNVLILDLLALKNLKSLQKISLRCHYKSL
ncbi:hypothetical protein N8354_03630 [Flavobacteriaceae bacterium]|nr:hypothetical protein [Flavobacteriaceae bacterium]